MENNTASNMVKIMYFRDMNNRLVGCMTTTLTTDSVVVGISSYNTNDHINKSVGKQIAVGRMEKHPIVVKKPESDTITSHDIVINVLKHVINNRHNFQYAISSKVIKSMQQWLLKSNQ